MIDIKSYDYDELGRYVSSIGEKPFRAGQVYDWLHRKFATDFDEMTNISKSLRERLSAECSIAKAEPVQVLSSALDGTKKFLFRFADGNVIESVYLPYHHGNSVCISTQIGCRMGCRFCASTLDGMTRNLTTAEMLEEVYRISAITESRISNVVLMGAGEPLDNFDAAVKFIRMISDEHGLNISQRNLTLSTCGLVPEIRRLAELDLPITLAISLHAPTQKKREELMPVARRYPLNELMPACRDYFAKTGRRITFEYSLIDGVNDSEEDALNLCRLLENLACHVNLIALNPIKERNFCESGGLRPIKFKNLLEKNRINVTIRREMGRDINGACGQLRKSFLEEPGN